MRFSYQYAFLLCGIGCSVTSVLGQQAATQAPPPVNIKTASPAGDDFYLPLPPRFVAGAIVGEASWSPDGRYVWAVSNDMDLRTLPDKGSEPPVTVSLVIWTASTHKSATVWSASGAQSRISQVAWLPGSSIAFVSANWSAPDGISEAGLWRVDARRSGATKIDGFNPDDTIHVSPTQPFAFVFGSQGGIAYLKPLAANGTIGAPITSAYPLGFPSGWTQDGRSIILPLQKPAPEGSGGDPPRRSWQSCDAASGRLTTIDKAPAMYNALERTYPFHVNLEPIKLTGASAVKTPWGDTEVKQAWLEQGPKPPYERMLIGADAQRIEISPRGDSILYVNNEGAFVVGLLRTPKGVLENARIAAQRTEILSNGKQIAMGVFMWSQDHNDMLPGAGDSLKDTLSPYVKNDAVFQGVSGDGNAFVYTLNGGTMKDIKSPATTMMGYIPGPGGYAVVYSDGHVQWATELPKSAPTQ